MRLAVVAPWHGRLERTLPLLTRVLQESTRPPDELWVVCEDANDLLAVDRALYELDGQWSGTDVKASILATPTTDGKYQVIPYSNKINWALGRHGCDAVCYLDNGSMPAVDKYRIMLAELEADPDVGVVYCTQERVGYRVEVHYASKEITNGAGQINFSAFMHRATQDRWTIDMQYATPLDVADAMFLSDLSVSLGSCWPVGGIRPLDWHHMESPAANGL